MKNSINLPHSAHLSPPTESRPTDASVQRPMNFSYPGRYKPLNLTACNVQNERQQAITALAGQLRHVFPAGDEVETIIHDRATALHDMGETPESYAENIARAQKMDTIADAANGMLEAFPFVIANFVSGELKRYLAVEGASVNTEALAGAIDGGTAMMLKAFSDKVIARAIAGTKWLEADAGKLEPAMQAVLKRRTGLGEAMKMALSGSQGFNGRNLVTASAAVISRNNQIVESALHNSLSIAAGGAGRIISKKFSATHGPEYLLGRTDWKAQYLALRDTGIWQQVQHGGCNRIKTLAGSMLAPSGYLKGVLNIVSGNMFVEITALAAGVSATNVICSMVRNVIGSAPDNTASTATINAITDRVSAAQLASRGAIAKDRFLNATLSALAYAFQGAAGVLAGPAPTRNDEWVDAISERLANSYIGQKASGIAVSSAQWFASIVKGNIDQQKDVLEMKTVNNDGMSSADV